MSEFNAKEKDKNEETFESYEDTIEVAIMSKVKKYFERNKKLRRYKLNEFLEYINLSDVFGTDEEKEIIWNIFSRLSNDSEEIDYNTCQMGMKELFLFYGITSDETEENTNYKQDNLYEFSDNKNNKNSTDYNTTQNRITLSNFRESLNNKEKKLDELLVRISMKNTPDKFANFNTTYFDSEMSYRKDSTEYLKANRFDLQNKINQIEEPFTNEIKRTLDRKITKTFAEIDIDKLQQLRKVFTILDLRNKDNVSFTEIQEVINKHKFLKFTTDELTYFLKLISDDIMKSNTNPQMLSINFELYSRAVSAIEQQLLQVNSDAFTEKNDSYDLNDNYNEIIEDLNRMEYETVDHIMVLADILKSSEFKIKESIIENYEKLLMNNSTVTNADNDNIIKKNIKDGFQLFQNKIKDVQLFLKEINQFSIKKQNKLSYMKIVVAKLENNLKNAEEDYRSLFEKFNMNQPVEIDDETERLIEENSFLNEQKLLKENRIKLLQKELNEKEEQIFYLNNQLEKIKSKEDENKTAYLNLKKEFEILEKNYKFLVDDIYDKIEKEENTEIPKTQNKNQSLSMKSFSNNSNNNKDTEIVSKLKDKLGQKEETKKVFEMNYDQLVLYTLHMESLNSQLEEKNIQKDKRIKEIEIELTEVKKLACENSKTINQLKIENARLLEKISEMSKDIEINNMFRPSRVLNNRISRISKIVDNSRISTISNNNLSSPLIGKSGNAGRFQKMKKLFDENVTNDIDTNKNTVTNDNHRIQSQISQGIARVSNLELGDEANAQFNSDINCFENITVGVLNREKSSDNYSINVESNNANVEIVNRITLENNSDNSFSNHFTFKNFPTKPIENSNGLANNNNCNNNAHSINQISNNYALDISSFTNGNMEIFSQADPFATNEKFVFDDKSNEEEKHTDTYNNFVNDKSTRVKYSFRPEDEYYIDINEEEKADSQGPNIIMDYMEENPFPTKTNEENNDEDQEEAGKELDTSVNWNKIAKHSPFDVDIGEMREKREKMKQSLTRQNTIETTTTAIFNTKINKRLPSLITEEILEEDINGDIVGTPSKPEKQSVDSGSLKKSLSNTGNKITTDENNKGSHTRMNTLDLDSVFNKDSQYVCYDFLTLRKNMGIISMLENNSEDVSSYEMFSDNVFLIDDYNKKSKKYLFITSNSVYILRPYDVTTKIKINLKDLSKLTISNKNCNLIAFHFNEGNDLLLEILRRTELLYYFRDLYRMKGFGKMKFKYSDNFKIKRNNTISNIIVNQANNFFIAPNFENAQKLGYLYKLSGRFFTNFNEKLVVLTNVGLLYFDDPNKPPKKLIPIIGSDIIKIDEKKYKRKYCFEIKTLNGEAYVFGTKSDEELDSWMGEFKTFKKGYEKKIKNIEGSSKK